MGHVAGSVDQVRGQQPRELFEVARLVEVGVRGVEVLLAAPPLSELVFDRGRGSAGEASVVEHHGLVLQLRAAEAHPDRAGRRECDPVDRLGVATGASRRGGVRLHRLEPVQSLLAPRALARRDELAPAGAGQLDDDLREPAEERHQLQRQLELADEHLLELARQVAAQAVRRHHLPDALFQLDVVQDEREAEEAQLHRGAAAP